MRKSVALVLLGLAACSNPPSRDVSVTVIPRVTFSLENLASVASDAKYDPVQEPVAWPAAGDRIVIAHQEQYSSADVFEGTCSGSGFYSVPAAGGPSRALRVGSGVCEVLAAFGGYALSPDGGQVAYVARVGVNGSRLAILDLTSGRSSLLPATCDTYTAEPAWSPDGQWLAFIIGCGHPAGGSWTYLLRRDGTSFHRVSPGDSLIERGVTWSPDGRFLALARGSDLVVMDTSGRNPRVIAHGAGPSWSPDGQWIAFGTGGGRGGDQVVLKLVHPDGTGERTVYRNRRLTSYSRGWGPHREGEPVSRIVWSPDSRWIAFSRRFDEGTTVWRLRIDTGQLDQVTDVD